MGSSRTIQRIAAGLACLVLWGAVVVTLGRRDPPAPTGPVEVRLPTQPPANPAAPSGSVRLVGTVRRAGAPAAARVEVERIADPGPRGRARSEADAMLEVPVPTGPRPAPSVPPIVVSAGDDGAFACDVAPGVHRLRAVAKDGATATTVVGAVVAGARREATLDLVPPEARGAITGRVRSLGDRPFAGQVRVARTLRSDARLDGAGATRPGPDGSFRVDGLERGTWRVQAIADDGRRSAPRVVVVPSLEPVDLDVEAGARWVTGRVVAVEDGAPVRGADVVSFVADDPEAGVRQATRTDDDGRYRVLVDAVAPNGVVVGAPGRASASVPWTGTDDLGEVRLERLGRVRGRIRRADGGVVPPGAVVWIAPDEVFSRFLGTFEIPTDADGGFDDASVPAGRYVVAGSADGFVGEVFEGRSAEVRGLATVDVPVGGEAVVDVVVVPAAEVRGTVLDALGTPAVGAVVTAIPSTSIGARGTETPLPYGLAGDGPRAVTGAHGTFRLSGLVPGASYDLAALDAADVDGPTQRVRPRTGTPTTVTLTLPVPRFVDVVVRERATGRPVAGADVESFVALRAPEPNDELVDTHIVVSSSGPSAVTDDAGRARLGPFGVGTIQVHARRPGGSWMRGGGVSATVADGPNGLSTAIEFDASAPWSGRVVRPDGSPAVGAEVRLEVAAGPSGASERAVRATDDGRFAFDDVVETSGRLSASVRSDDLFAPHRAVVAAGSPHTLRLEAGPLPGFVHVRVLDPDGRPVADASAICSFGDGARGSEFVVAGRAAIDVRDAEAGRGLGGTGTLEVRNASDGRGRRLPVGVARVTGVRTGTVVEVRLPRERTIEGRVVGPDGRGVAGVRVVAVEAAGPDAAWWITSPWMWSVVDGARTDGDGRFRVGRLSDGAHVVAALPPEAWVAAGPATADAGARDVMLALRVADVVTVTVRDADGRPVEGATVVAAHVEATWREDVGRQLLRRDDVGPSATTDADGTARLGGLEASRVYLLGVRPPSTRSELVPHVDANWRPRTTGVELFRGREVAGTVVDASGMPVPPVVVTCVDARGVHRRQLTGGDGTFHFRGLPPGDVKVEVLRFYAATDPSDRVRRISRHALAGDADVRLVLD